jgi:hypothetical protein
LRQILSLFGIANQMVHDRDEPVLIALHQLLERTRLIAPDLEHQAYVRVAEGQLRAGLAGRCHGCVLTRFVLD